jgi:DNA-binding NtrC family response regulator
MSQVLVVLESRGESPDLFSGLSSPQWQYTECAGVGREALGKSGADLVLLIGLPRPAKTLNLLRQFERCGLSSRILAIVPRDLEPADLGLVSRVADDFILWPEREEVVHHRVARFLIPGDEAQNAYETLSAEWGRATLVGRDPAFLRLADRIALSAGHSFPALITGETGTGKDLFARAIHFLSPRRQQPFIPVDCAGIPDHLFENELFGHARGAYTDAHGDQRGLAAIADKGTLFLDEVDSLTLASQAKLLRFLQDHRFKPLGSERYVETDVRIVAASNCSLEQRVAEKLFRSDLFFRLNVLHIHLPPLRERPGDIPILAQHFLVRHLPAGERKVLTPGALTQLRAHHWPGNVRELENVIQRAIVYSKSAQITGCDITGCEIPAPLSATTGSPAESFRSARQETIRSFEREYIEELLRRNNGNITWAAREAGKERRAFGRLVKKYGSAHEPRTPGQMRPTSLS